MTAVDAGARLPAAVVAGARDTMMARVPFAFLSALAEDGRVVIMREALTVDSRSATEGRDTKASVVQSGSPAGKRAAMTCGTLDVDSEALGAGHATTVCDVLTVESRLVGVVGARTTIEE